jgi:hypothetical protein
MDIFLNVVNDILLLAVIVAASACSGIALLTLTLGKRLYQELSYARRRRGISLVATRKPQQQ